MSAPRQYPPAATGAVAPAAVPTSLPQLPGASPRRPREGAVLVLVLLLVTLVVRSQHGLPRVVEATAPPERFSAARAAEHLATLARAPHPIGSAEHEVVRASLVDALRTLGLDTQIQTAQATTPPRRGAPGAWATVHNVIGRQRGARGGKAVLLLAHYDTVPGSPGAADDGAGLATVLETLRALRHLPPLKNDVMVLFSDAEEIGSLGAKAFVEAPHWARDIGVVLNFEARGNAGPSLMFEAGPDDAWLTGALARSAYPVTNSVWIELYKRLPNSTDMGLFKDAGIPGLNFAFIGHGFDYHSASDNRARLDLRSLQHHGASALALTRIFGDADLEQPRRGRAAYFNAFGPFLVRYPLGFVLPLTLLSLVLFVVVFVVARRQDAARLWGVLGGFGITLLGGVLALLAASLLMDRILALHPEYRDMALGLTYNGAYYAVAFACLSLAGVAALYRVVRRRARAGSLALGAHLWWLLLALLSAVVLPGANHLFVWPLIGALLGLAGVLSVGQEGGPGTRAVILTLGALPALLVLVPVIEVLHLAFGTGGIGVFSLMVAWSAALLLPQLELANDWRPRGVVGLAALAGVVALIAGSLTAGFASGKPKPNSVFYALDADTGKAVWASFDRVRDEWSSQYLQAQPRETPLTQFVPWSSRPFRVVDAPALELAGPEAEIVEERVGAGGERVVAVRVAAGRPAVLLALSVDPRTTVRAWRVGEGPWQRPTAASAENWWALNCYNPPPEGVVLTFEMPPSSTLNLHLVALGDGLPAIEGARGRTANMVRSAKASWWTDVTVVKKAYAL
jgi:hypothetical protein